jgi:putative glycosyltransferase (TIGR04372 family)
MDVEMFLSERDFGVIPTNHRMINLRYVWTGGLPISNQFILDLWTPMFSIGPTWLLQPIDTWNRRIARAGSTAVPWRKGTLILNQHNDLHGALRGTHPHLPLSAAHFEQARLELAYKRPKFDFDKPYVCIHIRDDLHFKSLQPTNRDDNTRNASFDSYVPAVKALIARGFSVVRLGSTVNAPVDISDSNFWDYAFDGSRSELLDVVLPAKCGFFVSTLSGPDKIAQTFRKPILFTNFAPLKSISLWMPNSVILPKHIVRESGQIVQLREIFTTSIYQCNEVQLQSWGMSLVSNSEDEILSSVIEMTETFDRASNFQDSLSPKWKELLKVIPPHLKAAGVEARFAATTLETFA